MPAAPCDRVWVTAFTGTLAEVWSTALMLLEPDKIADFITGNETVLSVHIDRRGRIQAVAP